MKIAMIFSANVRASALQTIDVPDNFNDLSYDERVIILQGMAPLIQTKAYSVDFSSIDDENMDFYHDRNVDVSQLPAEIVYQDGSYKVRDYNGIYVKVQENK
jgi:hypothetical protein